MGRLHTRYSPVRRSSARASSPVTPRLACVKPAASVHPEPGSNSSLYIIFLIFFRLTSLANYTLSYLLPFLITIFSMNSYLLSFSLVSFSANTLFLRDCKDKYFFLFCKFFMNFFTFFSLP